MTEEERELQEGMLSIRFYLYTLFSRAFDQPPDEELLQSLTGDTAWECLQTLAFDRGGKLWQCADFLCTLREKDAVPFLDQIQQEYTRLFLGPENPLIPLRLSAYQRGSGSRKVAADIPWFLQKPFHTLKTNFYAVEDQLSYQLNIMADLCQSALISFQKCDFKKFQKLLSAQRKRLDQHLLPWTSAFAQRMASVSDGVLYPQLGMILNTFLQGETAQIDALEKMAAHV